MNTITTKSACALLALPLTLLGLGACRPLSEKVDGPSAGGNLGFEEVRDGMPLDWNVYSPATIPTGSYALGFDREDFREGEQSLRFDVEACSPDGGWRSPGVFQELSAEPGRSYAIDFWIRSEGCAWTVTYGGVAAMTAEPERLSSTELPGEGWHHVERVHALSPDYERIRFELSVRTPGRLWIDGVRIEPAAPAPAAD